MKFVYSIVLVYSLFFVSCASKVKVTSTSFKDDLMKPDWQIVEIDNKSIKGKVNGKIPTLILDNGNYSVITGCNTLNGEFNLSSDNTIKFNPGMSTMMYCDDMFVEDLFKKITVDINSFVFKDGFLELQDNEGTTLVKLKPFSKEDNYSLENTSWSLDLLVVPGVDFKDLSKEKMPTISFGENGRVNGNSSCNNYRSSYKVDGNSIKFGEMASTKMMCPSINMENIYLETLEKVNRFSYSGDVLTLLIDDIAVLKFKKDN